jgi:NADP-dependent 3-hydroxy acid dehydrogenase YdfG
MAVATPSTKAQKSAIARESRQKARVFLAGRTKTSLEAVAKHITAGGGEARTAAIDALDDSGVNEYIDGIAKQTGRVDIVFDAAGPLAKQERWRSTCRLKNSRFRWRRW